MTVRLRDLTGAVLFATELEPHADGGVRVARGRAHAAPGLGGP